MVSAAMAIQDQSGSSQSNVADDCPHSIKNVLLTEQFPSADDCAPKVRKAYTISKQRERWTEEEHKKFLEALKLYGRAWRRIEEHVGTKTAVQIRSHAQKFFSKVVRESIGEASSVKPIEIPPPRPKRKPMHPYPRKMATSIKIGSPLPEQARRSKSPALSVSEHENQSPTSVLSAVGLDTLCSKDSNTRNGSLSPVSSDAGVNHGGFPLFESNSSPEENGSSLRAQGTDCSSPDEEVPTKVELFTQDIASPQSLKLFGKTVFVADLHKPSSPDTNDCTSVQTSSWNSSGNSNCTWSSLAHKAPTTHYNTKVLNENPDSLDYGPSSSLPCWAFQGSMLPFYNPVPIKASPLSDDGENQESEIQKEGSSSGSNTRSVDVGRDCDRNLDVESWSHRLFFDNEVNEQKPKFSYKLRVNSGKCMKGFVPYKRCLAERENNTQSFCMTGEERAEQRTRLCL